MTSAATSRKWAASIAATVLVVSLGSGAVSAEPALAAGPVSAKISEEDPVDDYEDVDVADPSDQNDNGYDDECEADYKLEVREWVDEDEDVIDAQAALKEAEDEVDDAEAKVKRAEKRLKAAKETPKRRDDRRARRALSAARGDLRQATKRLGHAQEDYDDAKEWATDDALSAYCSSDYAQLPRPTDLAFGKIDGVVTVEWTPVDGADSYYVYINDEYYDETYDPTVILPDIVDGDVVTVTAVDLDGAESDPSEGLVYSAV